MKFTDEDLASFKKDLEAGRITPQEYAQLKKAVKKQIDVTKHKWMSKKLPFM